MDSFVAARGGERLDRFIVEAAGLPRSQAQRLIDADRVTVNGKVVPHPAHRLKPGDWVEVSQPEPPTLQPAPEPVPLQVVYEDEHLIVADKPAGLTVHPGPGHPQGTLVNTLLARYPDLIALDTNRPGIVHRLDKDTSGLLVVARTEPARQHIMAQLKGHRVAKRYLALVKGRMKPEEGAIEGPIARHPRHRQRMALVIGGRDARTGYRVQRYLNGYTLVEITPVTGRTHQIRVHLSAAGYPVMGDRTYGAGSPHLTRQFLHATYLRLRHPATEEEVEFNSPLPPDLVAALKYLSVRR
ncbi:MAG: RluA family pseudouridine synthase [Dehalococcoidia bacterium]|nr:RluA family pseudouridine synthase [Dehalococcoidia bacterium]MDP7469456.1 RluA family pseudouridine synthase [Dehalococcoidia bacterium]